MSQALGARIYMSNHKPNHIPKNERIFSFLWGSGLLIWLTYGLIAGEFIIPGRRGREGTVFTEVGMYFIAVAMFIGSVNMFLVIADHYDKRDNELNYKYASRTLICVCLVLTMVGIVSNKKIADKKASPTTELASPIISPPT